MYKSTIKIGETSKPRFEFRTFGNNFTALHKVMEKLSTPVPTDLQIRITYEVYILSKNLNDINIKIRNNMLDVKKLIGRKDNLEQWDSIMKYDFPIPANLIIEEILPMFKIVIPILKMDSFDEKQFISVVRRNKELIAFPVHKKRYAYCIKRSICEFAEVTIGDEKLFTVSVESIDSVEVINTIKKLKLNIFENINYVEAIKRVKGLISKPLAN